MTNEQREAIEITSKYLNFNEICGTRNFKEALATVLSMLKEKDNIINKVEKETREHIGFENRLKRENREPDLFNQGRFYVANNINNILKGG